LDGIDAKKIRHVQITLFHHPRSYLLSSFKPFGSVVHSIPPQVVIMMPGNAGMTQEQTATMGDSPEVATPKTELEYEQEFPNRVNMKMTEDNVPECVNKGTFVSLTQAGAKTVCVAHLFFKVLKLRNLRSAQKASRYAQTLYSSDELIQMVTTSWVFESRLLGTHEDIWKDLNDEPPYDPKEYVKFDFQSKPAKIPQNRYR
jgi:hypothetical protein